MGDKHPNEDVEIVVVPDAAEKELSTVESRKIKRLIREKLLLTSKVPYRKVQVEVRRRPDSGPESLIASLLRAYTYTADLVKINVDPDFNATSVEPLSTGP